MGQDESDRADSISQNIHAVAYKRGGKVRKTGPAVVHRGERVIPASKRKKAEKVMRRAGMRLTNKKGR
jgi:SLT domain-containing protein